jgi:H+-transporting ATPase
VIELLFCLASLAVGNFVLHLDQPTLQTLTVATLVLSGQAIFYVARERRFVWSSRPGVLLLLSSVVYLGLIGTLALTGTLMAPLPPWILGCVAGAAVVFVFVLDGAKVLLFAWLKVV